VYRHRQCFLRLHAIDYDAFSGCSALLLVAIPPYVPACAVDVYCVVSESQEATVSAQHGFTICG
jgi:hypothetical protein